MVLLRATTWEGAGADRVPEDDPGTAAGESADNTVEQLNQTWPFVDQNQTCASHASHGELLTNRDTLVTFGANSIFLIGVDGTGTNIITQQDFILA